MKKPIIVAVVLFFSATAWAGNPMLRPLIEQEQYVYLANKSIDGVNLSINMVDLMLNLDMATQGYYSQQLVNEALSYMDLMDAGMEAAIYYDSMLNISVPKYDNASKLNIDTVQLLLNRLRQKLQDYRQTQ